MTIDQISIAGTEADAIEQLNDLLAKTNDPRDRAVIRAIKDITPPLQRTLSRELAACANGDEALNFGLSIAHSLVSTIAAQMAFGHPLIADIYCRLLLEQMLEHERPRRSRE